MYRNVLVLSALTINMLLLTAGVVWDIYLLTKRQREEDDLLTLTGMKPYMVNATLTDWTRVTRVSCRIL